MFIYVCTYIYIYICIERDRETTRLSIEISGILGRRATVALKPPVATRFAQLGAHMSCTTHLHVAHVTRSLNPTRCKGTIVTEQAFILKTKAEIASHGAQGFQGYGFHLSANNCVIRPKLDLIICVFLFLRIGPP